MNKNPNYNQLTAILKPVVFNSTYTRRVSNLGQNFESVYCKVFTSWQRGNVAANKTSVNFDCGRMAA